MHCSCSKKHSGWSIVSYKQKIVVLPYNDEENIHNFYILLAIREHFLADLLVFYMKTD